MTLYDWNRSQLLYKYAQSTVFHNSKLAESSLVILPMGWRRFFSSDNNNSSNPEKPAKTTLDEIRTSKTFPRLRIKPRKRNITPLAVAIVAIPFFAVGFRAYREPSFYDELQSYIPFILPNRKLRQLDGFRLSNDEESHPSNPSSSEDESDISKTILKTVHSFSETLNEEMNHKKDSTCILLSTMKVYNEGANSQDNEWLTTHRRESPMRDILDKVHNENLTMDELKQQIQQAIAQLEEQNRWEAFRIQEAVRAQALQDQQEWEKRKEEMEQYYSQKFLEEWKVIQQEMERRLEEQLKYGHETIESQVREEMEDKLAKRSAELEEEYEQRRKALVEEMDARLRGILEQERKNRLRMLENLQVQVRALRSQFMENSNFQHLSSYAHRISCIAYGLEGLLEGSRPFRKELERIKSIISEMSMKEPTRADKVSDVEMLSYLISTIPKEAAERGIPSEAELIHRFHRILKHLRRAALIPEEKVSSLWSHMVAYVIAWLKIPERVLSEGNDAESKISRAEYYVTKHNLLQAVRELEGLNGLCADLASDWLSLARWRVTVQQAVQVSRAFVVLEEEALA
ncbi:MI [Galdieria sulphuraria]|nr:MI [Galdieria sulphuraria]